MANFNSINLIEIYETNGSENKGLQSDMPKMKVKEHWVRQAFVVIEIDGVSYTVIANDLKRAIDNAQNTH